MSGKTLTDYERQVLREYLNRRQHRKNNGVLDGLHDKQLAFVKDPSLRKSALCGRRAGKTHVVTRMLVDACIENPDTFSVYIAGTRKLAKDLLWMPLLRLNRDSGLNIRFNTTELSAVFPNGAYMKLIGLDKEPEIEKLRGPKYKMVVLDESASFPEWVRTLVEDVLEPALEDENGTLLAVGTPGYVRAGYFYDITEKASEHGFSCHQWTVLDNRMFPQWAHLPEKAESDNEISWRDAVDLWLETLKRKKGWTDDNPTYQREWLGKWVASEDNLMYHLDEERNTYTEIPTGLTHILGIDLGWHDKSAFVIAGYSRSMQTCFEVESFEKSKLTVNQIAAIALDLTERFNPERIIVDGAGEGKIVINSLAAEISSRFEIPVSPARKTEKASFVRLLDGDCLVRRIKLKRNGDLYNQMKVIQWDDKFLREAEGQKCDLVDAFLYAYRECLHWAEEASLPVRPEKGTAEYWKKYEEEMIRREEEEYSEHSEYSVDWYDLNLKGNSSWHMVQ